MNEMYVGSPTLVIVIVIGSPSGSTTKVSKE